MYFFKFSEINQLLRALLYFRLFTGFTKSGENFDKRFPYVSFLFCSNMWHFAFLKTLFWRGSVFRLFLRYYLKQDPIVYRFIVADELIRSSGGDIYIYIYIFMYKVWAFWFEILVLVEVEISEIIYFYILFFIFSQKLTSFTWIKIIIFIFFCVKNISISMLNLLMKYNFYGIRYTCGCPRLCIIFQFMWKFCITKVDFKITSFGSIRPFVCFYYFKIMTFWRLK